MLPFRRFAASLCASSLAVILAGCSDLGTTSSVTLPQAATNWAFAAASATPLLPGLSGSLTGSGRSVSGVLHSSAATACTTPDTPIPVTGAIDSTGRLTLTGPLAEGTLTLAGTVAADGRSLASTSYTVAGGSCALTQTAAGTAQAYTSLVGTYAGALTDGSGQGLPITVEITQSTAPDANGNFSATGRASFPQNPCIASPSAVTTAQITGGTFSLTYTDSSTQNQVVTTGSFTADASKLTIASYSLTGTCADTGSGTLVRQ